VIQSVPESLRGDFQQLLDASTEIGTVDLFGGDTAMPSQFLLNCCRLLKKHQVPSPIPTVDLGAVNWGRPIAEAEFVELIESVSKDLDGYYVITGLLGSPRD
jgi:hypothetical protein